MGLDTFSADTPMPTVPTKTDSSDCARVGQCWRNHSAARPRQPSPTTTARPRVAAVCGPSALAINTIGTTPRATMHVATTRQATVWSPRAASTAVNQ